jgi:hypothetical protein
MAAEFCAPDIFDGSRLRAVKSATTSLGRWVRSFTVGGLFVLTTACSDASSDRTIKLTQVDSTVDDRGSLQLQSHLFLLSEGSIDEAARVLCGKARADFDEWAAAAGSVVPMAYSQGSVKYVGDSNDDALFVARINDREAQFLIHWTTTKDGVACLDRLELQNSVEFPDFWS